MSILKNTLEIAAASVVFALIATNASASSYCLGKYEAAARATTAAYEPQLKAVWGEIKRVQDAGLFRGDPFLFPKVFSGRPSARKNWCLLLRPRL
ncbi:hypothetical protein [Pararhizobium sp. A13]|uniref:hypothetical protein n=1 Tax=Pararhizobium sp. A13 TaxID=3133975 RepID=UPI0032472EE1